MKSREELLDEYDHPSQETKREIVKYLYDNPDGDHDPETIFETIRADCPANSSGTVANVLSDLNTEHERIALHERSFYQWEGEGRRRPNRRLATAGEAVKAWLSTLKLSSGTLLLAFVIWFLGILTAVLSLIPLFVTETLAGATFIWWFRMAGLLTICGSAAVMAWIPLYLWDLRSAD
ncbi:hypothetical protein EGH22_19190 [Halomicroarcula sp. F28]|uniref:hypothetical protein n=1 Tax=Haloarcula salinisoli TaxID=2487746 RepID=UPI001C7308CE|nr:hypothetical protein [Halomicroarcula salinisoli]MBX0288461.1 hypothetical protein [Halomicroarcula salinisoli]